MPSPIAQQSVDVIALAGVCVNVIATIILFFYTKETHSLRLLTEKQLRLTEEQLRLLTQQRELEMSPDLFATAEFVPDLPQDSPLRKKGVKPPYVLVNISNSGELAKTPVAFARRNFNSQGHDCVIDYGKEGISSKAEMPFFMNRLVPREKITSVIKLRFGEVGVSILNHLLDDSTDPFFAVICEDRTNALHTYVWDINPDGAVEFKLASFAKKEPVVRRPSQVLTTVNSSSPVG